MNVGKRIEQLAKEKGLKPAQLGELLGLSRTYIYTVLRAEDVSTEILKKAADVLEIPISAFLMTDSDTQTIIKTGAHQSGGSSAAGKKVVQKNYIPSGMPGLGDANTAQILEQLTKCQEERESWKRERASLELVISTQQQLIAALQTGAAR